jgi:hypothetical protein
MATLSYGERTDTYGGGVDTRGRDVGATIFTWVAWAAAAMFWGFTMTTAWGIVSAMGNPAANGPSPGEADVGGIGWMTINFIGGMVVLGGALAYGAYRYASRDRALDPVTEAATHALYDTVERQGGEDLTTRSPEARAPMERDAYRTAQRDL